MVQTPNPFDPLECHFCNRPAISVSTAFYHWYLCQLHTLSAGALGFWPRILATGVRLNPEASVREYFQQIEDLRRNYPELVAFGHLAGKCSTNGNTQVTWPKPSIPKGKHSSPSGIGTQAGGTWDRIKSENDFLKSLGLDGYAK